MLNPAQHKDIVTSQQIYASENLRRQEAHIHIKSNHSVGPGRVQLLYIEPLCQLEGGSQLVTDTQGRSNIYPSGILYLY
jgi:hypothetical protein